MAPPIHGSAPFVPASKLVDATGEALGAIRKEEGLTWAEVGEAIGKSDDQAAKYATGLAEMGFTTWLRACQRWNGRFGVAATMMGMAVTSNAPTVGRDDVRHGMLALTMVIADLQRAMLDDDLNDDELASMDALIDQAFQFLDTLRKRLSAIRSQAAELRIVQ